MPGFIGFPELLLLGLVVLLVFGPKRLPEMGRSLGRGLREFKHSVTSDHDKELERVAVVAPEPVEFEFHEDDSSELGSARTLEPRPLQTENERVA
jgi:sec-independent protein translocase protein TatA